MKKILILFIFIHFCLLISAQYKPTWESLDSRPVPSWFEDAKFGIFIHWGLYSVPAYSPTVRNGVGIYEGYAEWYWYRWKEIGKNQHYFTDFHNRVFGKDFHYQDFVNFFKAEMFSPDDWSEIFANSGAKYVVLTSKHHEGYTLWPSQFAWNWNAVETGPHRDLLGDLTKAVKSKGLKMGYYYSLLEWYNPLYKKETINQYIDQHMIPQMKELVSLYSPDIFWTDGEWDYTSDELKSTSFLAWLFNESPVRETVAINDRWGKETRSKHGGYFTTEYDLIHDGDSKGKKFTRPWEECRGMAGSFGYNRNERLEDYSTSEQLIHILIDKVARGGNLLLNIGPTSDGRIPEIMQQRLFDMGKWLKINGEAIYGTRSWEDAPAIVKGTAQYYTRKGNDLYLIVTRWQDKPLTIPGIKRVKQISMPGYDGKIRFKASGNSVVIIPPVITPANMPCNYAWVYKLEDCL